MIERKTKKGVHIVILHASQSIGHVFGAAKIGAFVFPLTYQNPSFEGSVQFGKAMYRSARCELEAVSMRCAQVCVLNMARCVFPLPPTVVLIAVPELKNACWRGARELLFRCTSNCFSQGKGLGLERKRGGVVVETCASHAVFGRQRHT